MPIDFDELLDDDDSIVIDPRDIFLTLESVHKVHVCFKRRTMILIMAR